MGLHHNYQGSADQSTVNSDITKTKTFSKTFSKKEGSSEALKCLLELYRVLTNRGDSDEEEEGSLDQGALGDCLAEEDGAAWGGVRLDISTGQGHISQVRLDISTGQGHISEVRLDISACQGHINQVRLDNKMQL